MLSRNRENSLVRPRVSALLMDAVKHPLTIVCAGAGYGKTRAVFDFTCELSYPSIWLQFSEHDNAGSRFWLKYTQIAAGWNEKFVDHCKALGFPDTKDKLNMHLSMRKRYAPNQRRLIVLDDIHLIEQADVLRFLERGLLAIEENTSVILICRVLPDINLASLQVRGLIPSITEDELRFTESELELYLRQQGLPASKRNLRVILEDTNGWAFSINLIAQSLKKAPGYAGYVRDAMKLNVFKLMETELFDVISERLRHFLVRISLIDHLSAALIDDLVGGDEDLIVDFRRQSAYIRFDSNVHAYFIHHLFLDFLRTRRSILAQDEIMETYSIAAKWCALNGFETDALDYWENVGAYEEIVAFLASLPVQMPYDVALCAVKILERAPEDAPDRIYYFAVMHVRLVCRLGRFQEALKLMRRYEERFLRRNEDDPFRSQTLGAIYYSWGNVRALMGAIDDCYDFDKYYAKMDACLTRTPIAKDQYADMPIGFWASLAGSSRLGAPKEYISAASRAAKHIAHCWSGSATGIDILCQGELLFYQGNTKAAEPLIMDALRQARENRQFETEHKALFYLIRLALFHGEYPKAEQTLKRMEAALDEQSYAHRYLNYDAALAWYYCFLRQQEMVPAWLKENFSPYSHAYFVENLGNQIKARYHYITGNYAPLLVYIEDLKQRESIIYGRVEMLALAACTHFKMKNRAEAMDVLRNAYEEASPNDILIPFIELGKDMRALSAAAMSESDCMPREWLEIVRRKSTSFAKHQSMMIQNYHKALGRDFRVSLSAREREVLLDIYKGLTRSEIAEKQALSVHTVNSVINNIFNKLGAYSIVDVVRIAAEEKLV